METFLITKVGVVILLGIISALLFCLFSPDIVYIIHKENLNKILMKFKNKYYQRLYEEWQQHGKIIIAIDFDDTISPWKFQSELDIKELDKTIQTVIEAQQVGAYVVVFTACNPDRYPDITQYCLSKGLQIDSINTTPLDLPYGRMNKIYANIFLDDRAGLTEALDILNDAMYKMRSYKQSLIHRDEIG